MSGVWRKTLVYLGLVEEPEEHDDLPEQFAPEDATGEGVPPGDARRRPVDRRPPGGRAARAPDTSIPAAEDAGEDRRAWRAAAADEEATNVRPLRMPEPGAAHVRAMAGYTAARVAVVHVSAFDHVEEVGARYRDGQPVLFDLSTADPVDARRVLDFVSGTTYALHGRLRRAGDRAFLLVPEDVDIPPDERERLAGLGYVVSPEVQA